MKNKKYIIFLLIAFNGFAAGKALLTNAEDRPAEVIPNGKHEQSIPDHEIKYEESLYPDWKMNWDLARELYRDKKYPEALVQYEILFTQKENIDEARWEYASILMYLERWVQARAELEKLLAVEPESIRYCLAMAKVNVALGNLENGVALYTRVLEKPVSNEEKILALEGLINLRELQERKDTVPLLLEQLIAYKPQDMSLLLKLAAIELDMGNVDRAKELCVGLEQANREDTTMLAMLAAIEEKQGNKDAAATYWQKVVGINPENAEAHDHLYTYYYNNENWAMSLKHLEQLIKMSPNDVELLMRAADLSMKQERIDRALEYYEFGMAVDPLNKDIVEKKIIAQKMLAEDLLVLVENDANKRLWQDLVKVAPDSTGVYREIANLLREQEKEDELIEVLRLLHSQLPDDQNIYKELASLLAQNGHSEELADLRAQRTIVKEADHK